MLKNQIKNRCFKTCANSSVLLQVKARDDTKEALVDACDNLIAREGLSADDIFLTKPDSPAYDYE